ncbi:TPA: cytochrome b [Burkholderia aenigmatica]|uniref:cytochrome b n=1 Tax=Burkholderia sp. AU45251 TaxID=3059204 RepID=UPI0026561DA4|nr:cytochrome b/b6 domain-containing protein [Burkholderia sp. AU45251]HDR9482955.1 cytochrome b [Burkholderia aenigmatica]MDN7515819.1 cytochrome b/b6 domain-containing protein [Burkholderia sp. AU45251]HDR9513902.1 cytochrome b [Burkholderia aenigmatica]HDR9591293.1 cytochrome b [Burkholderia aenigmatica]HDR9598385.1 cytochrome b [Burkholderia aenigmatica]
MKNVTRYPLSVSLLHWLLAAALIGNLIVGLLLDDNEGLVDLHKSIGIAILGLVAIRIVNRLRMRRRLPPSINRAGTLNHFVERSVHGLLYVLMLAIPVLGWMKTNAAGHTANCFGFFSLPALVPRNRELSHWLGELHALTAYGLAALVGLHVLGALAHKLFKSENVFPRILPLPVRVAQQKTSSDGRS